jgi:AsmA family protein
MTRVRRIVRWSLAGTAALVCLLLATMLTIGLFEISVSAGPWRGSIARAASHVLGRGVTLEGPLQLIPSLRPTLTVGGIRVANPPGFTAAEFASLGRARLRLELLPLLRNEIRVVEVTAEDVRLRLERTPDRRVNWAFDLPAPATHAEPQPHAAPARQVRLEEIDRIAFRRINAEYVAGGRSRYFALDEMAGEAARGQPILLTLRGAVEKTFPYTVSITGGALADLYAAGKPWPFGLQLEFAGTALNVSGSLIDPLRNLSAELVFGLGTENLSELERLLQTRFPPVGATGLSGRLSWDNARLDLSSLRGVMGRSSLEGNLKLDLSASKPRLTGELTLPALDLGPFIAEDGPDEAPAPESASDAKTSPADVQKTYAELQNRSYSLKELGLMDADLTLRVEEWIGVPGNVRAAQLRVLMQDGMLKAPVQATVADVLLAGEVDVDTRAQVPDFLLWLGTERSALGRLAEVFAGVRGVQGWLGRFKLQLKGRGDNLGAIVRTFDLRLDVAQGRLSYGNVEGGRPVEFKLDAFTVAIPAGSRLSGRAQGSLLGQPFTAAFKGGDLLTLTREIRWPLEVSASATGATLQVDGVLAAPEAEAGTDLTFRIAAKRAGDVARWLGLSPSAQAPVAIDGHMRVESDEWHLDPLTVRLGNTAMRAALARVGIGTQPLVKAALAVDNLDVKELEGMLPPRDPNAPAKSMIELPILPQGIDLMDADVDVKLKRVDTQPAPVTDVSFTGRIREGRMWPSPFSAKLAEAMFSGAMALDLRSNVPEVSVWVAAEKVDVGALLRQLRLVQDLDARVELLRAELIGRGSRLGDLLARSSLLAEMDAGQLTLRDPNKTLQLAIEVAKGSARVSPGKRLTVDLDGRIDVTPVTIRVVGAELPDLLKTGSSVPFSLAAEAGGARLNLEGKVALPITQREVELDLSVRGERFDSLNQLARVQLPPWGPWTFGGRFRVWKSGYEVPDLTVRVGESTLNGHGALNTSGVRPRLDIDLAAPRVQLNDFKLDGWSPFEKKETKSEKPMSVEEMRAKAKEAAARGQKLLSPEVLRKLDAKLDVEVAEVLSGQDQLGSGALRAQLVDGRFALDPAEVIVPGGSAWLAFTYEPSETDVHVATSIRIDRFDYGILARRIKPDTDMQGLFSVRMDLDSRPPTLDAVMPHANGRVDFAVWPRNLKAGIFDLWAVNLLVALVPAVDPAAESKVNCVVGRFDLRQGELTHDAILLDTSRMRVNGQGRVDFDTEALSFRLVPTAKSPQFFSLATPVGVNGTITDFKIGVSGSDLVETTARLFTSVIVVPLQKLTGRSLPRDGSDVCTDVIRPDAR